ncbi:MAG: endopeptidase La [Thermodesulfobacteriota bacterium]
MKERRGSNNAKNSRETGRHSSGPRETVPVIMAREMVLFPHMVMPMDVPRGEVSELVEHVTSQDRMVVLVTPAPGGESGAFHPVGTLGLILRRVETQEGSVRILLQGVQRVQVLEILPPDPYPQAVVVRFQDEAPEAEIEIEALVKNVRAVFAQLLALSPQLPRDLGAMAANLEQPGMLADMIASHLEIAPERKQAILEAVQVKDRLRQILDTISHEVEVLELGDRIQSQVKGRMDKSQRDYYLREQIKAIRQELGETDDDRAFLTELGRKIEAKNLPAEALEEAKREHDRLKRMSPSSAEFMVAHTYVEWLLDLPWHESTEDNLDLATAQQILEEDHCGLEMVKKRILEFLAVRKLKGDQKGPILCFIGPPGTGKTSMGRSIARALGRHFYRFSLGGMRDEAEIRGHRRTYVGAMPGRIIQALKRVRSNNPVLMLDEIDKLGQDFRGDPSSALLEVLDPEQNDSFVDHYLNVKFDLSRVLFITTANQRDTIPAPLYDRMEVIELPGYTEEEKVAIAEAHLIPRQIRENGLTRETIRFQRRGIARMIANYTRESGLRNLERRIAAVCRQVAYEVAAGKSERVTVSPDNVVKYLGPPKIFPEAKQRTIVPGVATGLAWTPTGGEILFVEASQMPGHSKLLLTGKLGEVMRESAQTALSFLRSRTRKMHLEDEFFERHDLHIHVPAGAIPKDGPSAGLTILVALTSLLVGRPVRGDVAMTGEVTLRGMILPVGGIKEKVLAAKRAGIRNIILPKQNNYDLMLLSETIREGLEFHLVSRADQAIGMCLAEDKPAEAGRPPAKARIEF